MKASLHIFIYRWELLIQSCSTVVEQCRNKLETYLFPTTNDESLTTFIYRWGELLILSCSTAAEQCRNKLETYLFPYKLANEKIARHVITKQPKTVASTFRIAKEELLLVLNGLSKETTYPIAKITYNTTHPKWCIHNSKLHNIVECRLHLQ